MLRNAQRFIAKPLCSTQKKNYTVNALSKLAYFVGFDNFSYIFVPLETIKDNYPKFLLTKASFTQNKAGIIHKNVFEWLLQAKGVMFKNPHYY